MGKRSSQRKLAAMLDSDDDNSSVSSSSTARADRMSVSANEEVQLDKDSLLDQALDALYEMRGSTREKALSTIIETFNSGLQHEFVEKNFTTLLHHCIASIKKGSAKEVSLASHAIGLLALTVGCGDKARQILEETVPALSQALKIGADSSKISALLECLAIVAFVGGNDPAETQKSMQIMWQLVHPKLGSNVAAVKPLPAVITAMVSAWAFLLTSIDGWSLDPKIWQESISYLSGLLDKEDRLVRIAAGEALAVIFLRGSLEKFCSQVKDTGGGSTQDGKELAHMHGLKAKVLNQVRNLSLEASGKGSAKKDLNSQRNLFKDILEFLETSMKIGGDALQTSIWCQLIQLNFLKHFLGGGFVKHLQNELLHDIFGFAPKKKYNLGAEHQMSSGKKVHRNCQRQQEKSICFVCQTPENLWMCVICGFVGCGRCKGGHAIVHWKETQHCYSLELETQRVWDYASDNYVHRLIQSKTDGKLVELNSHCIHSRVGCGSCTYADSGLNEALLNSKVEVIVKENNDLLAAQLENQKLYYETLLREFEEETEREFSEAVEMALATNSKVQKKQAKLDECVREKKFLDQLNENLMANQEIWKAKLLEAKESERNSLRAKDDKMQQLEEELKHLMACLRNFN